MIYHENIQAYLDYAEAHPEELNEDRKLLIKNIVIPTLADYSIFFDAETYEKCIAFCEGNYYPLFPYQKFIYAFIFMYRDDFPVFPTIIILMGRGNGKDGFMMPLMNFLQTPLYGKRDYNIDIVANSEKQANDSYNIVYDMLEENKRKFEGLFNWNKEECINKKTHSRLRYNTSRAESKDGKKAGAILFNEYHAYPNYDQINVFSSGLGKIAHARTFIITTQGYVRDGPLDELMATCEKILKSGENILGYFPFICRIEKIEDADNPKKWILPNPSMPYMPALAYEIKKNYIEMTSNPSKRPEFLTKRMNWPARDEKVTVASWEDITAATVMDPITRDPRPTPELDGRSCIIGIDYADIRDFASAGVLFKVEDEYIWRQHTWVCQNSPFFKDIKFPFEKFGEPEYQDFSVVDEKSLSVHAIVDWCLDIMSQYSVEKIVMDTYRFGLFRKAFEDNGIPIETRKNPQGIVRMVRSVSAINTLTAPLIEKAFVERRINFGPSAIMRWYTNNTAVKINKIGNKYYEKIEPKLRKNDGYMAFVVAMSAEELLDETIIYI